MERSIIRGPSELDARFPDCAALNPGYATVRGRDQFTRVQVWPPQNMPPKAQPCTRSVSEPFSAIVES